ncbi:hypothetical protein K435DRAFT_152604 [Dendrothele bispora CBS 962.96]|uniref:Uncharacterized protein n=1 Tax=Dendrothele bispora (strain CBS 962.96) TaxID=1314807 RepID=A0A4S8LQJ8_DENBC|nr:hypothetical protein K435DRAFT_226515 [Dendrothele bispora CBS 962.96]THU94872.1 hypothetical protein K435DRAFT_152604 [Dendrothele bispora CBS 962.96]
MLPSANVQLLQFRLDTHLFCPQQVFPGAHITAQFNTVATLNLEKTLQDGKRPKHDILLILVLDCSREQGCQLIFAFF